jgi:hypothetical protein
VSASAGTAGRLRSRAALLDVTRVDVLVVAVQALVFLPVAARRYVDGDEGDYLLAAQLVMDGQLPYGDFLHTQMPLLPYVYGVWGAVLGESWYAARALSALFAIALGTLLFRHLARRYGAPLAAVGLTLYVSSSLVLGWLTTVKTQALSTLLLFAAYVLVDRARDPRWLAAGVLAGLAIDVRLMFAAALPAFAWAAWRAEALRRLALGVGLGLLPALLFFLLDPRRFWFDNLGYHAARSEGGLVGDFEQKAKIVANLVGLGTPEGPQPQSLLLLVAALAAALVLRAARGRVPFALLVAAWLGVASLLPTPTYTQYFVALVPFLAVGVVELLAVLREPVAGTRWRRPAVQVLGAALAVYALLGLVDLGRFLTRFDDQQIGVIADVRDFVNAEARPGEEVLASWPGYLYGTHAEPVPGTENAYAPHEAAALSPDEVRDYRLITQAEIERLIEERQPRILLVRQWHELPPVPDWWAAARRGGYDRVTVIGSTEIFVRPDG